MNVDANVLPVDGVAMLLLPRKPKSKLKLLLPKAVAKLLRLFSLSPRNKRAR
jgi:hypothetical protein